MSKWNDFLAPRYWNAWIILACVRLSTWAPYRMQLFMSRFAGAFIYHQSRRRRTITETNIERCFPHLDADARTQMVRQHFQALAMTFMEIGMCWWSGSDRLKRRIHRVEGLEHLEQARARGNGAILLSAHFTTLEIGGRLLSFYTEFDAMYRPSTNPLIEAIMHASRERTTRTAIPRSDVRTMLKSLKENMPVWYAFDQGYRGKNSAMVPFFGNDAPTNIAISRLAAISKAAVIPFFTERLPGTKGYVLRFEAPLQDFPTDDPIADATRLNQIIEAEIDRVPEQYLWSHDRFKVVPRD